MTFREAGESLMSAPVPPYSRNHLVRFEMREAPQKLVANPFLVAPPLRFPDWMLIAIRYSGLETTRLG